MRSMTKKFKIEIEDDRWGENKDDKQLRITTNGWQWIGIYMTRDQLTELKDFLIDYDMEPDQ